MQNHSLFELDQLGDEIALLSAHLDAATARLLDLIREFDARGGWNSGFRSCAAWLSWRVGLDLGAARERVRVARARWGRCRSWPRPWPVGSCPTPRSAPSPAWPRRRPRRGSSASGAQARPRMASGSSAAGGMSTGGPRPGRPPSGIGAEGFASIRTQTAWWSSGGGSSRRQARCSCRRWRPRGRPCISGPAGETGMSQWDTETFPRNPSCGDCHSLWS